MSDKFTNIEVNPLLTTSETRVGAEPFYPLLDISELGTDVIDRRHELSAADQASLRPEEIVIHVHNHEPQLPLRPVLPLEILMKAANASLPEEIGYMGPTVASVNILDDQKISRYERQHGRDDLIAADDVKEFYPALLDTVVVSLAETQAMEDETLVPGQPYGFARKGSIILVNFASDDPLGRKFAVRKGWRSPFYGSADAPGLFVAAVADLQAKDNTYLLKREYRAQDGQVYLMKNAFDLSVHWLLDRMDENSEGLVEYRNPYTNGHGMRNQGWKDSADAMVHRDGSWVNSNGGVAPIEIQIQTVISLRKAAEVYSAAYNNHDLAEKLLEKADSLWNFILEKSWVEDEMGGFVAMGWDRDDNGYIRRIETRSIDMHSMLRLLDVKKHEQREMAFGIVRALTSEDMLTRWGNRVMSSKAAAYSDLRYHCGVWPDKSNRVAESMAASGLHGIDRALGKLTSNLIASIGCVPEHLSGVDSSKPVLPTKDVYVYNSKYNEVHLVEQVPPLGQTWGATSEISKQHRYLHNSPNAVEPELQIFEDEILNILNSRFSI